MVSLDGFNIWILSEVGGKLLRFRGFDALPKLGGQFSAPGLLARGALEPPRRSRCLAASFPLEGMTGGGA